MKRDVENRLISTWNEHNDKSVSTQLSNHIFSALRENVYKNALNMGVQDFSEDAISEAFQVLRAKVLSGRYDPDKPASAVMYCMKIALNKLKTERKRRIWQSQVHGEHTRQLGKEDTREPKEILIRSYDNKLIFEAISDMNEPMKTVFCLRTGIWPENDELVPGEKMTNEEIGAIYYHSHGWAAKQYSKAKEILYKKLQDIIE